MVQELQLFLPIFQYMLTNQFQMLSILILLLVLICNWDSFFIIAPILIGSTIILSLG